MIENRGNNWVAFTEINITFYNLKLCPTILKNVYLNLKFKTIQRMFTF